jgi:hypothetical protein
MEETQIKIPFSSIIPYIWCFAEAVSEHFVKQQSSNVSRSSGGSWYQTCSIGGFKTGVAPPQLAFRT